MVIITTTLLSVLKLSVTVTIPLYRPSIKGTKLQLKVIKAIIIIGGYATQNKASFFLVLKATAD